VPLSAVKSASFILLQGVPPTVSLDEVNSAIRNIDGVLSLHELHVWQLSENKIVASVHVLTSRNHDFMPIAMKIREALHHLGIHSCTIQPEYHGHASTTEEDFRVPFFLLPHFDLPIENSNLFVFFADCLGYLMSRPMSGRRRMQPIRTRLLS